MSNSKGNKQINKKQITKLIGVGLVDFIFTLELTDMDIDLLTKSQVNIYELTSASQLNFLVNFPELWSRISLSSKNKLISTMIYINKVSKTKIYIEFSTLSSIILSEETSFLKQVLSYVTDHNFLFLNERKVIPSFKSKILFKVKVGNQTFAEFDLVDENVAEEKEREGKKEETMFDQLIFDYSQFNYLLLDINDFLNLEEYNVYLCDVLNLISTVDKIYKDISFLLFFPSIHSNLSLFTSDLISQLSEIISYSETIFFEKKDAIAYTILSSSLLSQENPYLNSSFSQFTSLVSNHNPKNKSIFKIFQKDFALIESRRLFKKNRLASRKGIVIDDLSVVSIIETNPKQGTKVNDKDVYSNEFKIELFPKQNQANIKVIDEYKKQYESNKSFLYSVFLGGFISKLVCHCGYETSCFIGTEITKRCMEVFKLGLDLPLDNEFYNVDIKKSSQIERFERRNKKEKGFVLDCTNVSSSKLNSYNPLFDNSLSTFFSSKIVRRHLNQQGFINTNGFILLDTQSKKKNVLLLEKSPQKFLNKNRSIMLAIKENTIKNDVESIEKLLKTKSKALNDPSIHHIEKLTQTLYMSPLKNKLLPSYSSFETIYGKKKNQNLNTFCNLGKKKLSPINTCQDKEKDNKFKVDDSRKEKKEDIFFENEEKFENVVDDGRDNKERMENEIESKCY